MSLTPSRMEVAMLGHARLGPDSTRILAALVAALVWGGATYFGRVRSWGFAPCMIIALTVLDLYFRKQPAAGTPVRRVLPETLSAGGMWAAIGMLTLG
jgi:hypothetical protein